MLNQSEHVKSDSPQRHVHCVFGEKASYGKLCIKCIDWSECTDVYSIVRNQGRFGYPLVFWAQTRWGPKGLTLSLLPPTGKPRDFTIWVRCFCPNFDVLFSPTPQFTSATALWHITQTVTKALAGCVFLFFFPKCTSRSYLLIYSQIWEVTRCTNMHYVFYVISKINVARNERTLSVFAGTHL